MSGRDARAARRPAGARRRGSSLAAEVRTCRVFDGDTRGSGDAGARRWNERAVRSALEALSKRETVKTSGELREAFSGRAEKKDESEMLESRTVKNQRRGDSKNRGLKIAAVREVVRGSETQGRSTVSSNLLSSQNARGVPTRDVFDRRVPKFSASPPLPVAHPRAHPRARTPAHARIDELSARDSSPAAMRFEDDIDDAELLALMDAPAVPRSGSGVDGSRPSNATPDAEAPAVATAPPAIDPELASSLTATLKKHFGHDAFRAGQLDVVAAAVSGRDAAVYWSTGSGKSMCYQVPALHTGKTTLVVSPLVSLMQDQVTHLNNTAGEGRRELAAFLGSAQTDDSVQERALGGEFAVLYVTPEKLVGFVDDDGDVRASHEKKTNEPTYFVRRLKQMVERQTLGLVAVDEAHCVSQWGHDFRAAYRALDALRLHLAPNGEVPLMALTATAVGAVRSDIASVLALRDPFIAVNSCDRPNLRVRVAKRRGAETDLKTVADAARAAKGSVIVYCPSVRETEAVCEALRAKFAHTNDPASRPETRVRAYHARLSPAARKQAHMDFLVGACDVVVATVAFGMGIDKPDIRLVVHYGAPKTMEEYYQQVGRAGRDGLPSECLMLYGDNDFVKYSSEFYVGKLSAAARATQKKSTDALERFARDAVGCRRAGILAHFGERTPASWRPAPTASSADGRPGTKNDGAVRRICGTCDACERLAASAASGEALEAEYALECAPVLMAVARGFPGTGASMTHVVALATDSNPPANGRAPKDAGVRERVRRARLALSPTARSQPFVKEVTRALAEAGFLRTAAVKSEFGSYEVFHATPRGVAVADAAFAAFADETSVPSTASASERREAAQASLRARLQTRVVLPVPESLARAEADRKAAADAKVRELEDSGADTSAIPAAELEAGAGPALNAELQWSRALAKLRKDPTDAAKLKRADAMTELLRVVERWRDATAEKLGMAPGSVFASFVAKRVAYTCASGGHLDVESLRAAGVRVAGAEGLAAELSRAATELGLARESVSGGSGSGAPASSRAMRLGVFAPPKPWAFAVYKPKKKKGFPDEPPPWETSWIRFARRGEAPAAIAMTQPSGRAVQVATVVGHLFEALAQGRPVDFGRLGGFDGLADRFPTELEWRAIDDAAARTAQDPAGDPAAFSQRELLRSDALLGAEAVDVDRELKTETQKAAEASWYEKIRVYVALRRAGIEPEWDDAPVPGPDAKRARTT